MYPIPEFGGLYSKDVLFFRGSEKSGYQLIDPHRLGVISVAAYPHPPIVHTSTPGADIKATRRAYQHADINEYELTEEYANKMMRKIAIILNIALENGHDTVVLSALGCGAYSKCLYNDLMDQIQQTTAW